MSNTRIELNQLFEEYKNNRDKKSLSILEIKSMQEDFMTKLKGYYDELESIVKEQATDILNEDAYSIVKSTWSPNLNWNIAHVPELKQIPYYYEKVPFYGTIVTLYLSLLTTLDEVIQQFEKAVRSVSDLMPQRLIKCSDTVFLREFYERFYFYKDATYQDNLREFITRRFDVKFLEYSANREKYFEKNYANGIKAPTTTMMALVNEGNGNVIHKGECVLPKIQ